LNLKSHIILANHIADIIEEQIDIKIDRDMLELGAISPDMQIKKRIKIHNLKQVYNNYFIQTENIINKNKNKWGVSFSLGMLSHYVSDSFCLAHNMPMRSFKDFKTHVKYENRLSDEIAKYKLGSNVQDKVQENFYKYQNFDIYDFLDGHKDNYLKNADFVDFENQFISDIEHSIFCSVIVILGFISELETAQCPAVEALHI